MFTRIEYEKLLSKSGDADLRMIFSHINPVFSQVTQAGVFRTLLKIYDGAFFAKMMKDVQPFTIFPKNYVIVN